MKRRATLIGCACLLLGAVATPAANPRVTLTLANATPEDALKRLSEAAGVTVRLYNQEGARVPVAPLLQERFSCQWAGLPFAQAVRQVCKRFNLRPSRTAGGYMLYPAFQAEPPAPKRVGLFEKDGMRFFARSVSIYENRSVTFDGGDENSSGGLQLQITGELGAGDGEQLAGMQNVVARDDLGNIVGQRGNETYYGYSDGNLLPDEWNGSVSLPMVHPKAKKLTWLEGDLMAYRKVKELRVEMTLPPVAKVTEKRAGDAVILLSRYQETPEAAPEDDDALFPRAGGRAAGPTMRIRAYTPAGSGLKSRWGWGMHPYLITASGKIYTPTATSSSSGSDGQVMITQSTLTFPELKEPAAKLVWDLVERSDPEKLMTVRLTDIPLPQPAPFNPAAVRPLPRPGRLGPGGEGHPFYEKGGGTLVNRVLLPGKPTENGTLDLGLAPRLENGYGPIRWLQLEVVDGTARLEGVRPGVYRLMRRFRARDGGLPPAEGRWTQEDLQVTIVAAKDAEPAPLQWEPKAPGGPAKTVKGGKR